MGDAQSLVASIQFILSSASRFFTSEEHLRAELQQVGLPKEHAAALAKVHLDSTRSIREKLLSDSASREFDSVHISLDVSLSCSRLNFFGCCIHGSIHASTFHFHLVEVMWA